MNITQYSLQVQKMIRSVKRELTKTERQDLLKHGISGAFGNYVYTSDTMAFYKKHADAIWELLEEMAEDINESPLTIIQNFKEAGLIESRAQFENAMCWWSVTRCCEILETRKEEDDDA